MNLNNPYIFLRVLIFIDITLSTVSEFIPFFRHRTLIDLFINWNKYDSIGIYLNAFWIVGNVFMISGWLSMILTKGYGRVLYLLSIACFTVTTALAGGLGGNKIVVFNIAMYLSLVYTGFLMAMVYFGPVSVLFDKRKI